MFYPIQMVSRYNLEFRFSGIYLAVVHKSVLFLEFVFFWQFLSTHKKVKSNRCQKSFFVQNIKGNIVSEILFEFRHSDKTISQKRDLNKLKICIKELSCNKMAAILFQRKHNRIKPVFLC